ncbi:HPr family phosphocarrier protein [Lachnospiraceae bacterium LCP25S3_G4]
MAIMGMGIKKQTEVTVTIEGADEDLATAAMEAFFKNNL